MNSLYFERRENQAINIHYMYMCVPVINLYNHLR